MGPQPNSPMYSGVAQASPYRGFQVNVTGTINVAEAVRLAGVRRLVHSSTLGVHRLEWPQGDSPMTEDFPIGDVRIEVAGEFSFRDEDGNLVEGSLKGGAFVPTDRDETGDDAPADGGGGDDGNQVGRVTGGLNVTDGKVLNPAGAEGIKPGTAN